MIGAISTVRPNRCTGITQRTAGVSAGSIVAALTSCVSSSTSAKRGLAPRRLTASAVAMNELAGTTTSSPGPMSRARNASASASVPEETPTAWETSHQSAYSPSNSSTTAPPMNAPVTATSSIALINSPSSCGSRLSTTVRGCRRRRSRAHTAPWVDDRLAAQRENAQVEAMVGIEDEIDGLVARAHPELEEHRGEVALDGALREEQLRGDLAVHVAHHHQPEDLLLACREHRTLDQATTVVGHTHLPRAHRLQARSERGRHLRGVHDASCPSAQSATDLTPLDRVANKNDAGVRGVFVDDSQRARRRREQRLAHHDDDGRPCLREPLGQHFDAVGDDHLELLRAQRIDRPLARADATDEEYLLSGVARVGQHSGGHGALTEVLGAYLRGFIDGRPRSPQTALKRSYTSRSACAWRSQPRSSERVRATRPICRRRCPSPASLAMFVANASGSPHGAYSAASPALRRVSRRP